MATEKTISTQKRSNRYCNLKENIKETFIFCFTVVLHVFSWWWGFFTCSVTFMSWKISYTGRKEKRIIKWEWGPNFKILGLCFPWVFSDFSLKYLLRGYFHSWIYFFFPSIISVFFSDWLLRGRADLFALDHSMVLALGHFKPFGCSAPLPGCAMDLLNSPGSILLTFFGGNTSAWKHLTGFCVLWAWKKSDSRPNLKQLMGRFRKALRVLHLTTDRQEKWQGIIQSWPKFQRGLAEIAASQQSFGISTRLCQRRCEQL